MEPRRKEREWMWSWKGKGNEWLMRRGSGTRSAMGRNIQARRAEPFAVAGDTEVDRRVENDRSHTPYVQADGAMKKETQFHRT
jgi:hypothetical protein